MRLAFDAHFAFICPSAAHGAGFAVVENGILEAVGTEVAFEDFNAAYVAGKAFGIETVPQRFIQILQERIEFFHNFIISRGVNLSKAICTYCDNKGE